MKALTNFLSLIKDNKQTLQFVKDLEVLGKNPELRELNARTLAFNFAFLWIMKVISEKSL